MNIASMHSVLSVVEDLGKRQGIVNVSYGRHSHQPLASTLESRHTNCRERSVSPVTTRIGRPWYRIG